MAINMFVTNIPNGTSIDIVRGTAVILAGKLMATYKEDEQGNPVFDKIRLNQFAEALGVTADKAKSIAVEIKASDSIEAIIDNVLLDKKKKRQETFQFIKSKLGH